ncbi:putative plastid-lipid-associated protein 10, chloroplastic, variant 4 [Stylosanthes scabra]|uniref:Plastid-lipid-associated protein 10, chloroplastic, variant 4 n=1 Tax=Stylosanthes scabra TaxID=79078 RepID=A0ABU6V953_9FABA|nr:putative plastid-lipid-associated protein 10, chloroplastic, variant 4 [Stylosanthes scabra]
MGLVVHSASSFSSLYPHPPWTSSRPSRSQRSSSTKLRVCASVESRKMELLKCIQETERGLSTTPEQRASIEEALVRVEGYSGGHPISLAKLDGTWRLQYTSAPDVLILLQAAATLPFFQVGQIFQKFESHAHGDENGGIIRNIVRWSIPTFLEEQEGATLLVSAKFKLVSLRNIYLQFQEQRGEN